MCNRIGFIPICYCCCLAQVLFCTQGLSFLEMYMIHVTASRNNQKISFYLLTLNVSMLNVFYKDTKLTMHIYLHVSILLAGCIDF